MEAQTLQLRGASLYYETRGSGPVVLLIAGGREDAGALEGIATLLARDYRVVTYDPRGHSRSPLDGPPKDQRIEVHSDDAHRLLETVAYAPVGVFGSSSGAMVGLDLIARHPGQVARLVAHEPLLFEVLPDAATWRAFADDVYKTYQREGARPALRKFAAGAGLDPARRRRGAERLPEVSARRKWLAGNLDFFFAHEVVPFTRYVPALPALDANKNRIVLAGGQDSRERLSYRPAAWLAERFGTRVVDFPGGHSGYVGQPAAFAAKLREVLGG